MRNAQASSQNPLWGWTFYENWAPNQPAPILDGDGNRDWLSTCVLMGGDGSWRTVQCSSTLQGIVPICEAAVLDVQCSCPPGWIAVECSCYRLAVGTSGNVVESSWEDMSNFCSQMLPGARLPLPKSSNQTKILHDWADTISSTAKFFIGLRDTFASGAVIPEIYTSWGGGQAPMATNNLCGTMRSDAAWYGIDCKSKLRSYVCSLPRAATAAFVGGEGQNFEISLASGQEIRWGTPLEVQITQADTGKNLAVSAAC